MRIATVNDLAIGGMHLSHVVFSVLPDANPPFNELPAGKRGIIGMPVLLAMKSTRWSFTKRTFEFGFPTIYKDSPSPNLAFEGTSTFIALASNAHDLQFSLDTGAQKTDLYPAFAAAFPALVAAGKKETHTLTGVGGSSDFDSVALDSVTLSITGRSLTLKPAHVLLKSNNATSSWFAGNLGMDLLNQSSSVTIDWSAMHLSLQ
jgi:hypothetical protein